MEISHRTRIPLFAAFGSLPFIVGAVFWLATIAGDSARASAEIKGLRELVLDVRERVIRIETLQKRGR